MFEKIFLTESVCLWMHQKPVYLDVFSQPVLVYIHWHDARNI